MCLRRRTMSHYQKMYSVLFNAVSDALGELDKLNIGAAKEYLKEAQFHTEEIYMSDGRGPLLCRLIPWRLSPLGRRLCRPGIYKFPPCSSGLP